MHDISLGPCRCAEGTPIISIDPNYDRPAIRLKIAAVQPTHRHCEIQRRSEREDLLILAVDNFAGVEGSSRCSPIDGAI